MHRFYCPNADFSSKEITLTDKEEIHHLRDVLRLKPPGLIQLFDGKGKEATATICSISPQKVVVAVEKLTHAPVQTLTLTLACAIPKKSKFETIIEKATELGVDEIIPLKTKRTEVDLKGERLHKKLARFQTVAVNAAKQCQRERLPIIHPTMEFQSAVDKLTADSFIVIPALIKKRKKLFEALPAVKDNLKIAILIGPEGDFTPEEYSYALEKGAHPVSLGKTVLKVETAALSALAGIQLFYQHEPS
ncbi:MAG TPA: 16S rRNA (uracil(1498)-N(3))-methyltransferase [Candidatus Omnitrophota bacterium]|nr:16S rRNA (uracil(1498)-N(3))-methyltransferase [Candidatus Omnitrophota bacterium]